MPEIPGRVRITLRNSITSVEKCEVTSERFTHRRRGRTMKAKYRPVNRLARPIVCICLLFVLLAWPAKSNAHDEWFRGLDLESALGEASLVLAGRVVDV